MPQTYYQTPVGVARITETDGFISGINILDAVPEMEQQTSPVLEQTIQQMDEYFAGERRVFDFPNIDYAKTITYTQQSDRMKNPLAIRAIAAANGKNNLWVAVPCHRVIGANGELIGYAGGLWRKQWLLAHEAKVAGVGQTTLDF
jgi:methylated-DNA-[protein]-cysteine S-methyltransferase